MAGMLQILTYMLAFYLIVKGVEVLQIALASERQERGVIITIGIVAVFACAAAAATFVSMQDQMAMTLSQRMSGPPL